VDCQKNTGTTESLPVNPEMKWNMYCKHRGWNT
jgi:hypothetical protein